MSGRPISPGPGALFVRSLRLFLGRDFLRELTSGRGLLTMTMLSVSLNFLFYYGFSGGAGGPGLTAALLIGLFWISLLFSFTVGLGPVYLSEEEGHLFDVLPTLPADTTAFYLAKTIHQTSLLLFFSGIQILISRVLFEGAWSDFLYPVLGWPALLAAPGMSALGVLVLGIIRGNRYREIILPLIFFPLATPILLAGYRLSQDLLRGTALWDSPVTLFLLAMDTIWLTAGVLLNDFLIKD